MPIEIRELVIRAKVEETPQQQSSGSGGGASSAQRGVSPADMHRIVTLAAEEVMRALKHQKER